jgi:hypothetical protein
MLSKILSETLHQLGREQESEQAAERAGKLEVLRSQGSNYRLPREARQGQSGLHIDLTLQKV